MARSTARKRALNTLYEADIKDADILDLLGQREKMPGAQEPLPQYARQIVTGVADHYKRINGLLNEHASRRVSQMHVIDRNILRIGAWEMIYNSEVPAMVAIDEAMHLAKKFSDENIPGFIHAVLSAIQEDPNAVPEGDDESQRSMGASWKKHVDDLLTVAPKPARRSPQPIIRGNRRLVPVCAHLPAAARNFFVRRWNRRRHVSRRMDGA